MLDAFEAANGDRSIVGRRWVIEHATFLMHEDQMERVKKLGVLLSAQPRPYQNWEGNVRQFGKERADRLVAMREWLDHDLLVSGGTDWPSFPNNPFLRHYFWVTRRTQAGGFAGPNERISREEALRLDTINNAYMTFEENVKGSIEPGKLADVVVLADDYLTVPAEKIKDIKPVATYLGGVKVFGH